MDKDLRQADRSGDAAGVLRARLRAGELTQQHVELAARLGHPAALELFPDAPPVDWENSDAPDVAIATARDLLTKTLPARVAADWAERALRVWEGRHPNDPRPRKAIAAARAWAGCPCREHQKAVGAADRAASDAAWLVPDFDTTPAADAAACAAGAAEFYDCNDGDALVINSASASAGYAAEAIAESVHPPHGGALKALAAAVAGVAEAVGANAIAAAKVVEAEVLAAGDAAEIASAALLVAEREWQRLRLAAYVLGEVEPDEPAA
jgi:hypothetical protein